MLGAAYEYIGDDVFGRGAVDYRPRPRLAGFNQYQRIGQFFFRDAQLPAQQRELLVGHLIQIFSGNGHCRFPARRGRIELSQLQMQAFGYRTRADSYGVQRLHMAQHLFYFLDARRGFRQQITGNVLERFAQIPVIVDPVDNRSADPHCALIELGKFQLP